MKYDLIVVLASKPDEQTWQFPSHVFTAMNKAAKLYKAGAAPAISVGGKWAIHFDNIGLTPPFVESEVMAAYLQENGVPKSAILQENESKDTISNFYFLKKRYLEPRKMRTLLVIVAEFRAPRVAYLAERVLGPDYHVEIQAVAFKPSEIYPREPITFERTHKHLDDVTPGDDAFFAAMFYDHPFFTDPWPANDGRNHA